MFRDEFANDVKSDLRNCCNHKRHELATTQEAPSSIAAAIFRDFLRHFGEHTREEFSTWAESRFRGRDRVGTKTALEEKEKREGVAQRMHSSDRFREVLSFVDIVSFGRARMKN